MAENHFGSQESLPLSQDSYLRLFQEIEFFMPGALSMSLTPDPVDSLPNDSTTNKNAVEAFGLENWASVPVPNAVEQCRPVSSLPASGNWPGEFSFRVSFNPQKIVKGISWIYSNKRNKLYVGKDVPSPINFSTRIPMSNVNDVYIRAMALFSSADQASERVQRCINHSMDDINKNIVEAQHFIRCESKGAVYSTDPDTSHHSVLVPFENPPSGQDYSAYIFKFMCFGSCSGGPNRRPLMVVFTLESRGKVLGRQTIDLKVCACPRRDFKTEEELQPSGAVPRESKPVKRKGPDYFVLSKPKKIKEENRDGPYHIKTGDRDLYLFLKQMKYMYTAHKALKTTLSHLKNQVFLSSQSSSGSDNDAPAP